MRSGNKPGFKKMGATNAMKQVDTTKAAKGEGSEREIYKAKLRGDYMDLTGSKLKEMSYDDPTGTVVSKDHKSPMKAKDKTKEQLLKEGFTPADADRMIKDGAITGTVSGGTMKGNKQDFAPAYPGADYSKADIAKMSEEEKQSKIDGYSSKATKTTLTKPPFLGDGKKIKTKKSKKK